MELTKNERLLLKTLVEQELKKFESEEEEVLRPSAPFLAAEEKYDEFLDKLLEKLKE